ncbi:MAG: DUF4230 domain-containing protein [Phycisphaeraceae bacterium]|nr:DUF4230 domain-containing protein [Phycisphaeraceae bacterium]MCB9847020.1 DUF4230 domain-containing protein [Phycisphaeraceae bacterium]
MTELILLIAGIAIGVAALWLARRAFARNSSSHTTIETTTVVDRVRSVGRLVGLEVSAKEIATSTRGLPWLPPAILSKARLAMIFQFEKQYAVDLTEIGAGDVRCARSGVWTVTLPPVEGRLRLTDVTPYDISAGKALGLFDVIPMDAKAQKQLMCSAQEQASSIYAQNEPRYAAEARRSIESQLTALLSMLDVSVELRWREGLTRVDAEAPGDAAPTRVERDRPGVGAGVVAAAARRLKLSA